METQKFWAANKDAKYYGGYNSCNCTLIVIPKSCPKCNKQLVISPHTIGSKTRCNLFAMSCPHFAQWEGVWSNQILTDNVNDIGVKCECGGDTCCTTHSDWCPKYNPIKISA